MSNSPISSVRVSEEDRNLLNSKNLSLGEAIKRYCHELRIGDEMLLTRGLEEAREKISKFRAMNEKSMQFLASKLTAEQFDEYIASL